MRDSEDILMMDSVAAYEKIINKQFMDMGGMVMPGTLEDKHKNVDPVKGIPLMRRNFNTIFLFLSGEHSMEIGLNECMLKPGDLVVVPEHVANSSRIIRNCTGYCVHFK